MSGDAEQEYFSDGISEDLITDLSKVSALFVIARNSSFTYKGRSVKVQEIGRELGVRFVLEGSIRKAGNRVRITAQLVDAAERRPSVGRPVRPRAHRHLRHPGRSGAEDRRCARRQADAARGRAAAPRRHAISKPTNAGCARASSWAAAPAKAVAQARSLHRRALELDPELRRALCRPDVRRRSAEYINAWTRRSRARRWKRPNGGRGAPSSWTMREPAGHVALGNVLVWRRRHDEALAQLHRAIELDPQLCPGSRLGRHGADVCGPRGGGAASRSRPRCGSIRTIPTSCCI